MPYAYQQYTGNGSTATFAVPFPYLLRSHVRLYYGLNLVTGGYQTLLVDGTNYNWTNGNTVQLTVAPPNGTVLTIRRETPTTSRLVDWSDGSSLSAADMDTADLQNFYAIQEHRDFIEALTITPSANVSDGSITANKLSTDAVTTSKLADNTVTSQKIADGSITANKLSTDAVTTSKLADNAITSQKIADGAIVDADINAAAGVNASKLSFAQAGTGTVVRTVESKLRDTAAAADFGAVGDNTTNDTAAIAAARTAFPSTSIDLAGKSYRVTSIPAGWGVSNGLLTLAPASTDDQPANEAYGYGALAANTYIPKQHSSSTLTWASGNFNTAFGNYGLGSNTTGRRQTAFGALALSSNTSGYYNTAVGAWSLYSNTIGNYNTAVGVQALQYCTGSDNTAVGNGALTSNTNGLENVAIGSQALGIGTLNRTIAIGKQAGWYHTGDDSVAIGYQALSAPSSSGLYNIAIGSASLGSATTANSNVAVGRRSAAALTTGTGNTAIGNDAMVGSGVACTGSNNVAIGNTASPNITSGYQNVSVGSNAGAALGSGFNNTLVGRYAGQAVNSGAGNIAIGEQSLSAATTGNYNTAVGTGTAGGAAYNNTTMLGYQATVTGSDQVQLGNTSTTTYAYGAVQNRSDARDKADIQDTALGLEFINALRPVDFRWDMRDDYRAAVPEPPADEATEEEKAAHAEAMQQWRQANTLGNLQHDGSKKRGRSHHGLIAQEVKSACDSLGIDFGGYQDHSIKGGEDVLSIGYEELIAPLIKAVQQLSDEVEQLKARHG